MASMIVDAALRRIGDVLELGVLPPADHRPWPLPRYPWIMAQTWERLLFAHWPLAEDVLRPLIPAGLSLQTFDGHAWLGVTPFVVSSIRARAMPPIPGARRFPEINVRTYVTRDAKPGVFFFSLDAGNAAAVTAARAVYSLPYFRARFRVTRTGTEVRYHAERIHHGAPPAEFRAVFRPTGPVRPAEQGTLAHWLTERYCLYAVGPTDRLLRAEIHHAPWPLQPGEAEIATNTMTRGLGFGLSPLPALLHFSERLDVHVWPPELAGSGS